MMPKVDFGNANTRRSLNVRGANQRHATTNRQYIYGQVKVGGTVAYMGTSDKTAGDNAYLHMVLVHCDHEVEELGDLYVNGELVEMASGGEGVLRTTSSSTNRFYQSLYIADHLGGPGQTSANSTLDSATGDINSGDAFKGMAYTYIRMELKQPSEANPDEENAFPTGIPQFQRVVKGMKVYDPREVSHDPDDSTTWEYSPNWALCVAHFLQSDFGYGRYGLSYDNINETELTASANNCDEEINELWTAWTANETFETGGFTRSVGSWLLYSGPTTGTTGSTQPNLTGLGVGDTVVDGDITWTLRHDGINSGVRYELNGMVDAGEDPIEVLRKMRTAASGMVEFVGGEWIVRSGRYIAPTITLSESDFAGPISGTTKDDRTSHTNTVKGVIVDKHDSYSVIDAPSITNATFLTEDGGVESVREMELLFTNSHKTAQRLFKIELNKARQSISHNATFTSKAMQLQVGDTFQLNFAKYGYTNKVFEVYEHHLVVNDGALSVEMTFRETASNVYDWDHTTDETALDPAPNTTLPDPFSVPAGPTPTITSGTATLVQTADGTIQPTMHVDWTPVADINVIAYELRWERFTNQYEYMTINGRDSSTAVIGGVVEGSTYGVQIRCITSLKIGSWGTNVDHDVVGKSAAPTAPTGFAATGVIEGVALTMDEHPDIDFKQFLIYQNTTNSKPGSHSYTTTDTAKTITGLTAGQQYYFWLEAEDTTGHTTAAASNVNATPATFASDLSNATLSISMEVGQSGVPTDWSDYDMSVGFYVEGGNASYTGSTPTVPGQFTITGESTTPSGVTMLSSGSYPTVGVRGWPSQYGDFSFAKTYYVQYMDASQTLRNFSVLRQWQRQQRYVLGPPRFNPILDPAKGGSGLTFVLNDLDGSTPNDGEVYVGGTTFTKPDGTTTTGITEHYVSTSYEGGISPTTGTTGDFLLMWTDTAADTRFSPLTFTHQNVVPIRESSSGGYEVFNNVNTAQSFSFASTDVILAACWRDDTTTGITGIEEYVDKNPGQSKNYTAGSSGYKIDAETGDCEFNNGTFRGEVEIGSGDELCSITGTSLDYGDRFRIHSPSAGANELVMSDVDVDTVGTVVSNRVRLQGDNIELREFFDNAGSFDEFSINSIEPGTITLSYTKALTVSLPSVELSPTKIVFDRTSPSTDHIELGFDAGPSNQTGLLLDGDTTLYRSAASELRTDSTLIVDGSLGVGTSSPSDELHVVGIGKITTAVLTPLVKSGDASSSVKLMGGNTGGASISLYGESHASNADDMIIDVDTMTIRSADATETGMVVSNAAGGNCVVDIHGHSSSSEGGELRLHTGDAHDTTYAYYFLDAYEDDLRIGRAGNVDLTLKSSGQLQINGNTLAMPNSRTITNSTDSGSTGEICWDSSYIYVCTGTNTWKRASLSTW